MSEVVLTDEQARVVLGSFGPVTVRDASGAVLGQIELKPTAEQVAAWKRAAAGPGPFFSGPQVQARLSALQEEWDRTGGFDETHMKAFLARLDADDPGHMRNKGRTE